MHTTGASMNVLPLVDLILSRPRDSKNGGRVEGIERLTRWGDYLIESTIRDYEMLAAMEQDFVYADERPFERDAGELLNGAYESWCQQAGAVLKRIRRIERRGGRFKRAEELRDRYSRAMAMMQVTLDD